MKKILAMLVAAAMVLSLAVPTFATTEHKARLMYADLDWYPSLMPSDTDDGTAPVIDINGDGTYTIETDAAAGAAGIMVLCIDLIGVNAEHPDATVTLDSIEVDGEPYEFDASKILYGDIEENGNLRIEIYNEYGETKNAAPFNKDIFHVKENVKFTFTVSGLGSAETAETAETTEEASETTEEAAETTETAAETTEAAETTTETTTTETTTTETTETKAPATGIALAVVPAVVALAAAALSKKH